MATVLVTDGERAGEAIYRRENCGRCHTLFGAPPPAGPIVRPAAVEADPLDGRTGPDLGLEGHRRSDEWHYAHLYAPALLAPGSRMPPSRHLFTLVQGRPAPAREAIDLVAYLQRLGRARRDAWAEWRIGEPEIPPPPGVGAALLSRGDDLYRAHCAACHGAAGDGRGELAGFFSFPPRDFVAGIYRFKSSPFGRPPDDAALFRTITLGTGTGAAMPAFDWLDAADRWALVHRLKEFSPATRGAGLRLEAPPGRAAAPAGPDGEGSAAAGRRVWERLGCASCHGPSGSGMTREEAHADWKDAAGVAVPRSGDLTHACARRGGASRAALARAIRLGVEPAMPAYAGAFGSQRALGDLLAYLISLDTEPGVLRLTSPRTRNRR